MADAQAITRPQLFQYGLLALPLAFAGIPIYIHAPDFYATHHGVSLTLIGTILLGVRAFDAIQDPVLGLLSDRYRRHRLPIMLAGMAILGAGFTMLFHPLAGQEALWFAVSLVLATSAFSLLGINLNAVGGLWSRDRHQQTRITTTREALGLIGLMLAAIAPTVLQQTVSANAAFHYVSVLLIALLAIAGVVFTRWYRAHAGSWQPDRPDTAEGAASLWPALTREWRFYAVYGVSVTASAIPAVLVLFFIRDRLDGEAWAGAFLLLYFLAGIAGMPLWQAIARRHGKAASWLASIGLAIATFIWAYTLEAGDLIAYGIICIASGMALGAELALPPALLAEKVASRHASAQFAGLTFLLKSGMALAAGATLPLLEYYGYVPGGDNSAEALHMLSFTYALLPCALKAFAGLLLWRLLLTQEKGETHAHSTDNHSADGGRHVV